MIAIYARQSLDKKDSISIETQINFGKMRVEPGEEYEVYKDKGYSGSNIFRPDFERMLQDIKEGFIHKVICYKVDRISRSTLDFAYIISLFKEKGVEFVSCQENFDTTTPIGKAMLSIIMIFAELERENIQGRVKDNYYERGKEGRYLGGPPAFGYSKEKVLLNGKSTSILVEVEPQISIRDKLYHMYDSEDMTLGQISKILNGMDIPSAQNVSWDSGKISRILRNPVGVKADISIYRYYKNKGCIIDNSEEEFTGERGCYLFGKREANERKYTDIKDHHLSLGLHKGRIDSDVFLRCQDKLDRNVQIGNTGRGKYTYLTGLVKCANCGYAMTVFKCKGDNAFRCSGKYNLNICEGSDTYLSVSEVEDVVTKRLLEFIKKHKESYYIPKVAEEKEKNEFELKIFKLETARSNIIDMVKDGLINDREAIANEINKISAEISSLSAEYEKKKRDERGKKNIKQMIYLAEDWDNITFEQKKRIVKMFIEKINISDKVRIIWKENIY